ncbi:hypothetical protein [Sphingomonas sp. OK281]|uniref:hypothetical protein n=1 Tax=Sphingomonas sp. OK281 TaxID=1881067 RepID=UPI0008E4DC26|nr:hypothetical protein [Sphingomonas sp. OK281]SFO36498.1 hypothetical protein SAMN05428984_3694 [Sphingomonas sp. OK281]
MGRNTNKAICVIAVAAVMFPNAASAKDARPGDYEATVVSVGKCAFTENDGASDEGQKRILGAIAAAAISQGVNLIGKALGEAAKAKTWTVTAARNIEPSETTFPQCIQVVRGRMWAEAPATERTSSWTDGLEVSRNALVANGTYPAATPDFFFEGEIIGSKDKTSLAVRPTVSYLGIPIGERALRPGKARSIALFVAITAPGSQPSLDTAPAASLNLGRHEPGVIVRYPSRTSTNSSPRESAWFTLAKTQAAKPLTVSVLTTETQSESGFLSFIATVLSDEKVKTEVTTQLQQALIPATAASAAAADDVKLAGLRTAAETAFATALAKVQSCMAGPALITQAGADAKGALRTYVAADQALAVGDKARSGALNLDLVERIDLTRPATIAGSCRAINDQYLVKP